MTIEQLRVFVAVAEREHVTRAAEALHLAQSAVSAHVAALEARHGTKLFHRVGRGIELTEAGRLFLVEARAVLARMEAAELVLAELAGLRRGTLLVQASQTIASHWLPRYLVAFHRTHPGIAVRLGIGNTAQVATAIRDGSAELGFVEGDVEDSALRVSVVARDGLVLVVGQDHPWAGRDGITPADLGGIAWVLREPGSGTRAAFEAVLLERGLDPGAMRVALELPSNEAVCAAVEAGGGATVVSASVAASGLEAGLLYRVPFDLPDRRYCLIRHDGRTPSRAASALIAALPPFSGEVAAGRHEGA